jgi:hypothetical protein
MNLCLRAGRALRFFFGAFWSQGIFPSWILRLFFSDWISQFAYSVIEAGVSTHKRVQLHWFTGQSGIIGNEEAHDLAGLGSKSDVYVLEPCLPVLEALMTCIPEEWFITSQSFSWNLVSGCKQFKIGIKLAKMLRS